MYTLQTKQKIPASIDEVWSFISSPANLKHITPEYMGFEIIGPALPEKMYEGMMIHYIVRPLAGIPMQWVTEITHVRDREYFVDEQRVGPYRMWHHEHRLSPITGGVLMSDTVHYIPPFGVLGQIAQHLFIRRQLDAIFNYRTKKINEKFGVYGGG